MIKQTVRTDDAPSSPLFSQAVRAGPTVYVSGMVGADPKTGQLAGATIQEQTRQALLNCEAVLKAAGATRDDVVDVHLLLARPGDFAGLNEEYAKFVPSDPPARAVSRLGPELAGVLVSIRMVAIVGID